MFHHKGMTEKSVPFFRPVSRPVFLRQMGFANLKSFEYFCGNDFQPEDSGDMPGTG